jgi:intracellular multiplication protein IcmJ
MLRKADKAFLNFQEKILQRDNHTCQFCGFQANQHLDVVNLDNNFHNNKRSNLATACPFCVQCFFLESVGQRDFGGASIVLLPEMGQNQLNALCHVLFSQMANSSQFNTQAKNIYRSLKLRAQLVEKQVGEGMSKPAVYGRLLVEVGGEKAVHVHRKLTQQIRLLPLVECFTAQIQDWSLAAIDTMID